jgi:hypothetical protein
MLLLVAIVAAIALHMGRCPGLKMQTVRRPVAVLNVAHEGLPAIEKVRAPPAGFDTLG